MNIIVITPKSCLNLNMICKMKGPLWGHVACAICRENYSIRVSKQSISPAFQPNSEKFQQGSRTITVFRGVHFRVTSPRPQRLKPNRFAVGNLRKQFGTLKVRRSWKRGRRLQVKVDLFLETGWEPTELGGGAACCG